MRYLKLAQLYEELYKTGSTLAKTKLIADFLKKVSSNELPEIITLLRGRAFPEWDRRELGLGVKLAIKAIASASGNSVEKVEKLWKKIGDLGEVAEKVLKDRKQSTLFRQKITTGKVIQNLQKLTSLEGTGTVDRKVNLLKELLISAEPMSAKYIVRTCLEDLRVGAGSGVLRDAISQAFEVEKKVVQHAYDLSTDFGEVAKAAKEKRLRSLKVSKGKVGKPIRVMLYQKVKDIEEGFKVVGKPAACFPAGSLIYSNPRPKQIENFDLENFVIGRDGKFKKVTNTFKRDYSGELIKIKPHYLPQFNVTPEHRILAVKHKTCSWKHRSKIRCRPNCQEQKYGCRRKYKDYSLEWVKADELERSDFIVFPIFKETENIKYIDLSDYINDYQIEGDKIRSFSPLKGVFKGQWVNQFIKFDSHLFELLGWYLAEGSASLRGDIRFSLGSHEQENAKRIQFLLNKVFGLKAKIVLRLDYSTCTVRIHSKIHSLFLNKSFDRGAKNKVIPKFVLTAKKELLRHFLQAYIKGDGAKAPYGFIIATSSQNICMQLILAFSKIGILPSVYKKSNAAGFGDGIIYHICLFGKNLNNFIPNSWPKRNRYRMRYWTDENFFYIPISKIEKHQFRGEVYNLETEDNTYLSSALVHNCELKIDGFRLQIHKSGNKIWLFTRRLENVTDRFPDIVEVSKKIKGDSFIIDCEVVGIDPKTKRWLPFQNISQRIKRKYRILEMVKSIPVMIIPFDVIFYEGKDMISAPFKERRKLLAKIIRPIKERLEIVEQIVTDSVKTAEKFMQHSLALGNEGMMMKNLEAVYKPGSRVGYGVKIKPVVETLDLVITGAEWGHGKRGGWLSSFKLACRKGKEFLSIGKMGTGIKEKREMGISFAELTKLLKPLIIEEKGGKVKVKPKVIVEAGYEEIQKSPSYKSGYALRFPRLIRLRPDKSVSDVDSLERVKRLYKAQRGRK